MDLVSGRQMAFLEFHTGVEEIFDVQILPGIRSPVMSGPHPHLDGKAAIWTVPASALILSRRDGYLVQSTAEDNRTDQGGQIRLTVIKGVRSG